MKNHANSLSRVIAVISSLIAYACAIGWAFSYRGAHQLVTYSPVGKTFTIRLAVQTTASSGQIFSSTLGSIASMGTGFAAVITEPGMNCAGIESAEGGVFFMASTGVAKMALCSNKQINDGVPHRIEITLTPGSKGQIVVDGEHEATSVVSLDRGAIKGTALTIGTGTWAPPLDGEVSDASFTQKPVTQ